MLNQSNVGKIFMTPQYKYVRIERIGIVNGIERYYINEHYPEEAKGYSLWIETDLAFYESKQEQWQESKIRSEQREKEYAEKQRIEKLEQDKKENLYGFDLKMSPMQKAKVLKCMMKEYLYDGKVMTRRDFIIDRFQNDYIAETFSEKRMKKVANYDNPCRVKSMEWEEYMASGYRVVKPMDKYVQTYEITKTEFDFFNYLVSINFIKEAV